MEIELSEKDKEEIATKVALKLEKFVDGRPIVYSVEDVSDILKCHKNTVLNYIENKLITAVKQGKSYIITQENLTKFLNG